MAAPTATSTSASSSAPFRKRWRSRAGSSPTGHFFSPPAGRPTTARAWRRCARSSGCRQTGWRCKRSRWSPTRSGSTCATRICSSARCRCFAKPSNGWACRSLPTSQHAAPTCNPPVSSKANPSGRSGASTTRRRSSASCRRSRRLCASWATTRTIERPAAMPRPTVSVVVPAYNAAAFLRRAIDSVLGQTAVDLELLVVDDGSTDATLQLLAGYGERLQAIPQVNAGPAGARNRGLALARGRYIAFLDADDWWLPEKLGRQVALLDSRPEIGFCSTGTRVVHAAGT